MEKTETNLIEKPVKKHSFHLKCHFNPKRFAGVLCHITSLPSKYGIGDLGKDCTNFFLSFLQMIGHSVWSVLPCNTVANDYSPYNARSSFAGNYMLIAVQEIMPCEPPPELDAQCPKVQYEIIAKFKRKILYEAYQKNFNSLGPDYAEFKQRMDWLDDYSVFMAAGEVHGNNYDWSTWEPVGLRAHEKKAIEEFKAKYHDLIEFHCYIQYEFFKQMFDFKKRTNVSGISLFGDLAFYINYESADVWANQEIFTIDPKTLKIIDSSGVTADMFSETGQFWGHPLYRWDTKKKEVLEFWVKRLQHKAKIYDQFRIDHTLGLVTYCAIPWSKNPTPEEACKLCSKGQWRDSYGTELFTDPRIKEIEHAIFFEDRGPDCKMPEVYAFREKTCLPGMASLQDAFGLHGNKHCLPHNLYRNCYLYIGTHDDYPLMDYIKNANPDAIFHMREYLNVKENASHEEIFEKALQKAYSTVANGLLIQIQDILPYKEGMRMNYPGTTKGNWEWKFTVKDLMYIPIMKVRFLKRLVELYERK